MWAAILGFSIAQGATQLRVEITVPEAHAQSAFRAELRWLGEEQSKALEGQGVLGADFEGEELRFVPIEIWSAHPQPHRVYAALESVPVGQAELHYVPPRWSVWERWLARGKAAARGWSTWPGWTASPCPTGSWTAGTTATSWPSRAWTWP